MTALTATFIIKQALSHVTDAPFETGRQVFNTGVTSYMQGMPVEARPELLGYNSDILCVVMAMLLLVAFNIRQSPKFFRVTFHDLWSLKERNHLFDTSTVSETRAFVVCVILMCICEALLGIAAISQFMPVPPASMLMVGGVLAGIAGGYYLWQVMVYKFIGYVFFDKFSTSLWLRGFNASQILLGALLLVPALTVLFYPSATVWLLIASVLFYFCVRLIFISKGFRIFYQNFSSLLYFILYLCSVEIVPVILLFNGVFSLCCNLIS
ncbi:MAG: DUF4271 domain-containing protein [Muribaculum sp.]|nr:DUF4271 domain-containing protein [Muribaculum sp.]